MSISFAPARHDRPIISSVGFVSRARHSAALAPTVAGSPERSVQKVPPTDTRRAPRE